MIAVGGFIFFVSSVFLSFMCGRMYEQESIEKKRLEDFS